MSFASWLLAKLVECQQLGRWISMGKGLPYSRLSKTIRVEARKQVDAGV